MLKGTTISESREAIGTRKGNDREIECMGMMDRYGFVPICRALCITGRVLQVVLSCEKAVGGPGQRAVCSSDCE